MIYRLLFLVTIFFSQTVIGQGTKVNKSDSVCGTFGYACGIGGMPQPSMIATLRMVNAIDRSQILNLSQSDNPQNKAYGLVGLYFLKKNGIELSKDEEKIIDTIRKSETQIDYCQGCAFGRKGSMKFLFTKKKLNSYYAWYISSRYKDLK
jgi:hypothetical protein